MVNGLPLPLHCVHVRISIDLPTIKFSDNFLEVDSCSTPENMTIGGQSQVVALGSTAELSCIHGYKLSHSLNTLPSLCDCNGNWNITKDPYPCQGVVLSAFGPTY